MVIDYDKETKLVTIEQRRKFSVGDTVEILLPNRPFISVKIEEMWDEEGNSIESAPHPLQIVKFKVEEDVTVPALLRKEQPL